ncbi:hypothetical protein DCO58_01090 [Helicobacter saguini]|uniref:Uncharacterized protein n=1 Tax=Helicobacter saguini TaxID=1548018 RepID=A0A099B616_9HELI|nr:hypothetical protein [Helicobacter saguini]MWV63016.1 hypothetical protein [Helicobacter saguini]MWV66315.1 hypothetical protein [Helicobacter saguini]MWV68667.1 hypothetical protein [Helicobacter saguini]MWV71782.1 hypothetical protein [Helicobacter saguini]TLD95810.1 hypothetical protein LS64_000095 [Helicobacter saguini]
MGILDKKMDKNKSAVFKDVVANKDFVNNIESKIDSKSKRGRKQSSNKRNKTYTFYCTKEELEMLEKLANDKHLTMAEYFRVKLFN